jgi:hypothetical protein
MAKKRSVKRASKTAKKPVKKGKKKAAPVAGTVVGPCIDLITAGELVQEAVPGGPHDIDTTLEDAGLISAGQRAIFRSDVVEQVSARGCTIDADAVPNSASTTLRDVKPRSSRTPTDHLGRIHDATSHFRHVGPHGAEHGIVCFRSAREGHALSHELVSATISQTPPRAGFIVIEFGRTIPRRYLTAGNTTLPTGTEWTIETRERVNPANLQTVAVTEVARGRRPGAQPPRRREARNAAGSATHQIRVRLRRKLSRRIVAQPRKAGASAFYGTSKGKDDADIYFKGLRSARQDRSCDCDRRPVRVSANAGRERRIVGAATTYNVDKASDIGPERSIATTGISVGGTPRWA